MSYYVEFIATRPNKNAPFFYDAPEHAEQMAIVDQVREEIGTMPGAVESYSKTYSEDELTCKINIVLGEFTYWHMHMSLINTRLPMGIITRNLYFIEHGHKLVLNLTNELGMESSIVQVY